MVMSIKLQQREGITTAQERKAREYKKEKRGSMSPPEAQEAKGRLETDRTPTNGIGN